jgi:hypothetical protein
MGGFGAFLLAGGKAAFLMSSEVGLYLFDSLL